MTREEARRRAVDAAGWAQDGYDAEPAIATYERAMADAGWRMVRVGTDEWDIPGEFGEGWNACRRAMLGDDE